MPYAENTNIPCEKSRAEIETTLNRYGASSFGYMSDATRSTVGFECRGRLIRIQIAKADGSKLRIKKYGRWQDPTEVRRAAWVEQENRRRWRALLLVIKAKLEAIQSGIATFEDEFLPYTVTNSGETVAEWATKNLPQLAAVSHSNMPMLSAGGM